MFEEDPLAPTYNEKDGLPQLNRSAQPAQMSQDPSAGEQFGQMAMNRAMEGTLDAGQNAITGALAKPTMAKTATEIATASPQLAQIGLGGAGEGALIGNALTGKAAGATLGTVGTGTGAAAGAGGMAALGAAMPYVGAGILAGKALGFFNDGGHVGPLYAADGNSIPTPVSLKDALIKSLQEKADFNESIYTAGVKGQTPMKRAKYAAKRDAIKELAKESPELMQRAMNYKSGGGPLYAAKGKEAKDEGMLAAVARKLNSAKNYVMGEDRKGSDANAFLKGEGVQYNAMGGGPLSIRKVRYKQDGGKIELEATMGD